MVKLRLISTKQLVQPLGIPASKDYTWVIIPYSEYEMVARRNCQKCAHIQLIRNTKLEEPSR